MIGSQQSVSGNRERALPDGQSIPKSTGDTGHDKQRLQFYQRKLEETNKRNAELEGIVDEIKSDWRREVTDLLNSQRRKETDHELLRQENTRLKEEIMRNERLISQLNEHSTASIIQGEPHLVLDTTDPQLASFMQKLAPQLKSYRIHISSILSKAKQQQQLINNLFSQLVAGKAKGIDYRRPPMSMSMESSSSNYMGAPLTGPTSNFNLTLSLASASSDSRFGAKNYDAHPNKIAEAGKYQQRPYQPDTDISRLYGVSSNDPRELRHRRDPVESSDHIYSNDVRPVTLDSNAIPSDSAYTTMKKSVKTPKPVPRARTSLKSLNTNTISMASAPASVAENMQSYADTYEIVDKPPISRPLGAITENASSSGLGLASGSSSSSVTPTNQPTRLAQHTVQAHTIQAATYADKTASVADARNISQVCDVCHREFPNWSQRQFMDHCIECAEDAAEEEEDGGVANITNTKIRTEARTCPVCSLAFSQEVTQTEFENHVHGHFMDDDTQAAGWETITK